MTERFAYRRPRVTSPCIAGRGERIIEFSDPCGGDSRGGLISFKRDERTGKLLVEVYRCEPSVEVRS